ncbi:MAG: LeuA family protein [Planctomycetota bacterium]|jgi:2-isopropylmalate synthase
MIEPTAGLPSGSELIHDWNLVDATRPARPFTLNDETLRDGLQSPSVTSPTLDQKVEILHLMAKLGIERVNLGLPGAGPHVVEHVERLAREIVENKLPLKANCAARTVIADIQPIVEISQRTGLEIEAATFLGSSPIRRYTEDWDRDRLLRCTEEAVTYAVKNGCPAMYVTEDTTRTDPDTVKSLYRAAIGFGATRLVVCDTVGHATPSGVRALIRFVRGIVDEQGEPVKIDWHGHNDRGLGLTNALSAITSGADSIHGCGLGIGERCGNTSMDQLLINLKLLGWWEGDLSHLADYCDKISRYTETQIPKNYPAVGSDAFETGTGVHAAAVIKALNKGEAWLANRIYSGVPADELGLEQKIVCGPMSGKSNVRFVLDRLGLPGDEATVERVFQAAKGSRATAEPAVDEWQHFGIA